MSARLSTMLRKLARVVPNAFVLGCLLGALYWGHSTHWSFGAPHAEAAPGAKDSATAGQAQVDRQSAHANADAPMPPADEDARLVKFDSPVDVGKAGLVIDRVEQREMEECVVANGIVGYDQTRLAQLSVRVPGIVWRVEKQVGQFVSKGEVLVLLDSVDVGRAKADFLQSVVHYDLKARNLARLTAISTSVPERAVREAEAQVREARVTRFNAQQTLVNLGLAVDLAEIQKLSDEELARHVHFLGLPEAIAETLDPHKTTANLIPLVAPFDGIVIGRELVQGEVVEPSHTQFTLADVRKMWILLNVDREDVVRVGIGQQVVFSADGMPREASCRVGWISTEVDSKTRTVQVRAEVENPLLDETGETREGQRLLRANVYGTGRIRVGHRPNAVAAPRTAVHAKGSRRVVFLPHADGRTFEPRDVRTGISQNGFTEVLDGLSPGDRVVTTGSYMLKSELFGSVE